MDEGQRRAKAGGEVGANGEWYRGGLFIATQEQTVKQAPLGRQISAEDAVRRAEEQLRAARIAAWLEGRRAILASIVMRLTANPGDVDEAAWRQRVSDHAAGFLPSLGRTLDATGTLTERQAVCVVKALVGRRSKFNAGEWDSMMAVLVEEFA